ncbi:unnamed protein product [Discosporangium mesarthrocarpum]
MCAEGFFCYFKSTVPRSTGDPVEAFCLGLAYAGGGFYKHSFLLFFWSQMGCIATQFCRWRALSEVSRCAWGSKKFMCLSEASGNEKAPWHSGLSMKHAAVHWLHQVHKLGADCSTFLSFCQEIGGTSAALWRMPVRPQACISPLPASL